VVRLRVCVFARMSAAECTYVNTHVRILSAERCCEADYSSGLFACMCVRVHLDRFAEENMIVNVYICGYIFLLQSVYVGTYVRRYMCTYTYIYLYNIYMYIHVYTHLGIYIHTHINTFTYIFANTHAHTHTYIYKYIRIHQYLTAYRQKCQRIRR